MARTVNVSNIASQVIMSRLASYIELDTVLSLEDALNILEVHQVNEYNKQLVQKYGNECS
ncbi:hypothetical protein [Snodgrassella communis]|uniref:hypothetical protein n=1 Tax=Snodgrassella communis TaxID=2946699 RepID=UPI001184DB5E|nr:hypothetical protein [Snodgrassella communis]